MNIANIDFILIIVKGNRGTGKTLFATNYALEYHNVYPNHKMYGNYNIKLPNYTYSPFMFLKYSEINNALIIIDDVKAIKNFNNFIFLITNWSRKAKLHIILTGQYYTMFTKETRTLAEYEVQCRYLSEIDELIIAWIDLNDNIFIEKINNAVKNVKSLYDTNEKVPIPTETTLLELIEKESTDINDLEVNLSLYFSRSLTRKAIANFRKKGHLFL